jgi:hypothetical protein
LRPDGAVSDSGPLAHQNGSRCSNVRITAGQGKRGNGRMHGAQSGAWQRDARTGMRRDRAGKKNRVPKDPMRDGLPGQRYDRSDDSGSDGRCGGR